MKKTVKKSIDKKAILPIFLCWIAYTIAYIGRYGYSASIEPIKEFYNVSETQAGLVGTMFFISYGVGQVVNGLLCKRYNKRLVVSLALIVSALLTFTLFLKIPFEYIKYVWLLNGIAQSFLWTSIINSVACTLKTKDLPTAIIALGTSVGIGTFTVYGLTALFTYFNAFNYTFLISSILMAAVGAVWLVVYNKVFICQIEEGKEEAKVEQKSIQKPSMQGSLTALVLILVLFAVVNNFVKDGLATWAPSILKETFNLSSSFSIFLTVLLPLSATFGAVFNTLVGKKIKSFITQGAFWYLLSSVAMLIIALFINTSAWLIVLILISFNALFMASINNLVTAIAPLYLRDKINTGLLAGVIDGCCYVGSALSLVCFALVKELSGTWANLFIILTVICLVPVVITLLYNLIQKLKTKK
ncbi:MAG: MFS transporter [Clostridia bacterium]|nr:MFS transporter [Clostridia bacterium]